MRYQLQAPAQTLSMHRVNIFDGHGDKARVSQDEIAAALGKNAPPPLHALLAHSRRTTYDQRQVLYYEGGSIDSVFFITAGLLKLVIHLPNGRARIVRLHRPGTVLGLSGLMAQSNPHTAVAVSPITALRLPLSAVQRLRKGDPVTYVMLVELWHEFLQDAYRWITDFSTGSLRGRVARLLSFLSEFETDTANGQLQLLTCEEMGSILGVTTESVSRTLAEFKRQNIIVHPDGVSMGVYRADLDQLRVIGEE